MIEEDRSDNVGLIGTVVKAGALLREFTSSRPRWCTRELSEMLGFSRPTTHRLLATLQELGMVRRTDGAEWILGTELIRLGAVASVGDGLREKVRPFLTGLVREPGDSAYLFVPQDGRMFCIDRVMVASTLRLSLVEVGASVRMGKGSASRVAAAFGAVPDSAQAFDPTELGQIRAQGHALNMEELAPGVCAISAPLLSRHGSLEGVICLGGLRDRFSGSALYTHTAEIMAAAEDLSRTLGFIDAQFPPPLRAVAEVVERA